MKCEDTSVMLSIKPIAYIHSDFSEKFGIPRQSGLVDSLQAKIIFTEEFRNGDCIRGIEEFSHLWLIWEFSKNQRDKWTPTVRPPRLGGNKRKGVFASRAPFRPNPLGLSCVRLEKAVPNSPEGPILYVSGADLLDGTPIYDIKPYLPYADSIPEASLGFAGEHLMDVLEVVCSDELWEKIPEDKRGALEEVLSQDPRPAYHEDETRKYGMEFAGFDIIFHVKEKVLYVDEIKKGNLTTKSKLL